MFKKKQADFNVTLANETSIQVFGTVGFKVGHTISMDGRLYEIVQVKSGTEMIIRPLPMPTVWERLVTLVKRGF